MRLTTLLCFISAVLFSCHTDSNQTSSATTDTLTVPEHTKADETPLSPGEKHLQEYVREHHISGVFQYSRDLNAKTDSFSLDRVQNFDKEGRLISLSAVNATNTETYWKRTFVYNTNGVLLRMDIKLQNGQQVTESYIYQQAGRLLHSYTTTSVYPVADTFEYRYSADTLYKYHVDEDHTLSKPDIRIFNKSGWIIKSIEHIPWNSNRTDVAKYIYADSCPLPLKEIIIEVSGSRERINKLRYYADAAQQH